MGFSCSGACPDCPYDFCEAPATKPKQTDAARRRDWKQDALFELEELGDLWGIDPSRVRL
ncbi:hypothetical protein [Streptomyces sp. NPDC047990]|uniref:hypothetical protein n=1 Tax=Streptomyces sp. NPDC047990 TaxID=3365496 RepID=UPI00371E370A